MRPTLNGLLDGLLSRGRLIMPIRAWTFILISPVTRRRKGPFPQTILESQTPLLRPAPPLHLLLPLLTFELLPISLLVCLFVCLFFIDLRTRDIHNVVLNAYPIFSFCCLANLSCLVFGLLRLLNCAIWILGVEALLSC